MNNKKLILKNIISSLLYQAITLIYGFIVPVLIIQKFGSNVNGLISSISQFLAYIYLLEGGISPVIKNAIFEPLVKNDKEKLENILGKTNVFFKRISYVFLGYIFLLCCIYPTIINNEFSFWYTVSLIIIIAISRFSEYFLGITYSLFLKSDQKNYIIDNINSISYIVNLILVVILVKLNVNIQLIKLITSIMFVARPIILRMYFRKKYKLKISKKPTYKFEKQWDGLAHHIAATVQGNTDIIVLTVFSNLVNVSIYSVYALVTNGIRAIIVSLTNGMDAFFGKLMVKEENNINNNFDIYSFIFYTITTILLSTTLVLIVPFISVYTRNITDANYVIPIFAYILVFAEFNYVIRYPYSTIAYAKGHFKETKNFSIVEPIVNIIISILLVPKYGLIGVAIGTLISMPIRSIGFINYGSKKLLKQSFSKTYKIILVSLVQMVVIFLIHLLIGNINVNNYLDWILLAVVACSIITLFVLTINAMIFKEQFKKIFNLIKKRKINV